MIRRLCALAVLSLTAAAAWGYDNIKFLPNTNTLPALKPTAVAASEDRLYVLDEEQGKLGIYSEDGKPLAVVGSKGSGSEAFSSPKRLAVGPDGTVFVADTGNSRVQMLDPDGKFIGRFGTSGSGPGQLDSPEGVAVGQDGRVYVADTDNHRVQVFTREGVFLFGFGTKGSIPGTFNDPGAIHVDASDNLYVLDEGNDRIQKFDARTRFVKQYPLLGQDLALDAFGFLYMLEPKRGKVKEVNPEGSMLGEFGSVGAGPGQFKKPGGVAIASNGDVLVADTGNGRVSRIELATKTKTTLIPPNLAMKLFVAGPTSVYPYPAAALAASGDKVYAYLSKAGNFVALDVAGEERLRFGKKQGKGPKDPTVTKGTKGFAVREPFGIFVADTESDRMQVFTTTGGFASEFAVPTGMFGSGREGRLSEPTGVAVTEKGTIYVADTGNRRISVFSPEGAFLSAFSQIGPHELRKPVAVAFDEAGYLFVLDRELKKVFKCEPSGGYVAAWGEGGSGVEQFSDPVAMAFDGRTYLYVLDQGNPRVLVFDKDGSWVTNFFARGTDQKSLLEPVAVTVSGFRLVVADPAQNRILTFKLKPQMAPPSEVSTKAVAGLVTLEWAEVKDPWVDAFRVFRAVVSTGPYREIGAAPEGSTVYKDTTAAGPQTYFYRIGIQADTGDVGPRSRPVLVSVPASINRAAIEISTITLGNIFSARYKWYLKNPLGKATLVNNTTLPYQNVKLSFRLKDFMDFATDQVVENLGPRQKVELEFVATLNNRILEVTEDTPIQAEFKVTYFESGKAMAFSRNQPLRVYSRNAITWDDPKRIATFITTNDTPIKDFAAQVINKAPKGPAAAEYLNPSLKTAIHIWDALGAVGVRFQTSPNNPFEQMSEDPAFPVDYTQFPRETLKRKSGECDDLVTLVSSLFENKGVRTAVLDYPGHLAMMFDTGAVDPMEVGLPATSLIKYDGTLWIPLEATMVGSPFQEAARKAIYAYKDMVKQGKVAVTDPRTAWKTYEPATLPEDKTWTLDSIPVEDVSLRYDEAAHSYLKERYDYLVKKLKVRIKKDPKDIESINELGIVYFQHEKLDDADKMFAKAIELDPGNSGALNNLGNLAFIAGRYEEALANYQKAAEIDPGDAGLWLNLARTALNAGQKAKAREYGRKAIELDSSLEPMVQSLLK